VALADRRGAYETIISAFASFSQFPRHSPFLLPSHTGRNNNIYQAKQATPAGVVTTPGCRSIKRSSPADRPRTQSRIFSARVYDPAQLIAMILSNAGNAAIERRFPSRRLVSRHFGIRSARQRRDHLPLWTFSVNATLSSTPSRTHNAAVRAPGCGRARFILRSFPELGPAV